MRVQRVSVSLVRSAMQMVSPRRKIVRGALFVASPSPDLRNEKIDHMRCFLTLLIRLRYYLHLLACVGKRTLQQRGGQAHRGRRNKNLRVRRRLCLGGTLSPLRSSKTIDDFGELS
ncbi:UNVERIFIED_CONTAM: hypothetical protein HHA_249725 [Hammondia hammondi]|eukprot:XP_008888612.1 hypothetical protein HHA_249725 [Hammondia hammondi]